MAQASQLPVFRSVLLIDGVGPDRLLRTDRILRPPVSVPNVVDNLWEWTRPEEFPSRRFAAFASPKRKLEFTDMMYAGTAQEALAKRKPFVRKWRLMCRGVADSLEEAGDRLFTILRYRTGASGEHIRSSAD